MMTGRSKSCAMGRSGRSRPQADWGRIDATTEEETAVQIAEDEAEAMRDAAASRRREDMQGCLSS
jgi:hypothetical protein